MGICLSFDLTCLCPAPVLVDPRALASQIVDEVNGHVFPHQVVRLRYPQEHGRGNREEQVPSLFTKPMSEYMPRHSVHAPRTCSKLQR